MNVSSQSPLGNDRKNAVIAGVLFVIGTVSGVICAVISNPIMQDSDSILGLAANPGAITLAAMLQFIMGISCAGISIALYPILKKYSSSLAIGAVSFRLLENLLQILKAVSMISLLAISQEFLLSGNQNSSIFQYLIQIVTRASDWMTHGAALICFTIGAGLYYIAFYQHRLIPRWISLWGLIAVTVTALSSLLMMFNLIPGFGTIQIIANGAIFVQEMVFAFWLIAVGVKTSPLTSMSFQPALS